MQDKDSVAPDALVTEEAPKKTYSRTLKAGILASGQFLTTCVALVSAMVLARVLTKIDYATYRQTMLAYGFAAPLLTLGLPQALYYFLPGEKERARGVLIENLLLLSFMGAIFSLFLLLGGNSLLAKRFNNPDLSNTLRILIPYSLAMFPAGALGACLVARDRVGQVAVYNVLSRVLQVAMIVAACLIWQTPMAALAGAVLAAGIILIPALKLMLAACKGSDSYPRMSGIIAQLKFSLPLGLAGIVGTLALDLDKVLVSSMCSPEAFAVFVNGAMEIPLIAVLTGSITSVLLADFASHHRAGEYKAILDIWHRATVKCAVFLFPIGIFLLAMAPEVMRLLFSSKYSESAVPFRIYILRLPVRITTFGAIFMASGNSRLVLYRSASGLVLNCVVSIFLIHYFGAVGAALGTVIVMYLWTVPFCLFFIRKILRVSLWHVYPWGGLAKVSAICAAASTVFVARLWVDLGDFWNTIVFGGFFGVALLGLYSRYGIVSPRAFAGVARRLLKL